MTIINNKKKYRKYLLLFIFWWAVFGWGAGNSFSNNNNDTKTGKIAITIDDVPRGDTTFFTAAKRTQRLIRSFKNAQVPDVLFFVRTSGIDEISIKRVQAYIAAGFHIGNHSHSHMWPDKVGVDAYIKDIHTADNILKKFKNVLPFYRYPLLREGKTPEIRDQIRDAVKKLGYQNGYVTVDNYDFHMDVILQKGVKEGKKIDFERLKSLYVNLLWDSIQFYDRIAREVLGRSPSHILLLHENDMAALFIGDLVEHIRSQGWVIVSPSEAYEDPIAGIIPDVLFNNQGRIAAIAHSQGFARKDLVHPSEDIDYLDDLFLKSNVFK